MREMASVMEDCATGEREKEKAKDCAPMVRRKLRSGA
jgi:hypothetical protein